MSAATDNHGDLLDIAADVETCLAFLPPAGQKNIGRRVAELRALATRLGGGNAVMYADAEFRQAIPTALRDTLRQSDQGHCPAMVANYSTPLYTVSPRAPVGVERVGAVLQKLRRLALVIREHGTCAPLALDHIGDDLEAAVSSLAQQEGGRG